VLQQSSFTLLFCRPGSSRPRSRPEGGGGGQRARPIAAALCDLGREGRGVESRNDSLMTKSVLCPGVKGQTARSLTL